MLNLISSPGFYRIEHLGSMGVEIANVSFKILIYLNVLFSFTYSLSDSFCHQVLTNTIALNSKVSL